MGLGTELSNTFKRVFPSSKSSINRYNNGGEIIHMVARRIINNTSNGAQSQAPSRSPTRMIICAIALGEQKISRTIYSFILCIYHTAQYNNEPSSSAMSLSGAVMALQLHFFAAILPDVPPPPIPRVRATLPARVKYPIRNKKIGPQNRSYRDIRKTPKFKEVDF